jgi:glycine cleavage system H protein
MPRRAVWPRNMPGEFVNWCDETVVGEWRATTVTAMSVPESLRYTTDHEWVEERGAVVRVGITHYAQDALGAVVFVQLPAVGAPAHSGEPLGEVESTKSVSDLFAPVDGQVVRVNLDLVERPELVNHDPYGAGWLYEIEVSSPRWHDELMTPANYRTLIGD